MTALTLALFPFFALAQGGAVFLTALFAFRYREASGWLAKIGYMGLSYVAWIIFTYVVFFSGADIYIVFFGLTISALLSSICYCVAWIAMPLMRSKRNV